MVNYSFVVNIHILQLIFIWNEPPPKQVDSSKYFVYVYILFLIVYIFCLSFVYKMLYFVDFHAKNIRLICFTQKSKTGGVEVGKGWL